MVLAYLLLQEGKHLTPVTLLGIAGVLGAVIALAHQGLGSKRMKVLRVLGCAAVYGIIFGGAAYGRKYFALNGVSITDFLFAWYGGTAVSAWLILGLLKGERGESIRITIPDILAGGLLSVGIITAQATMYWAYQITPLVIAQPIFLASRIVLPVLLGLLVFKEIRGLERGEIPWLLLAGIGGFTVALGYATS